MNPDQAKPCIVQRDRTVLLETGHAGAGPAREQLQYYAELLKSPSGFHTYRLTPLSLWNAAETGWGAEQVLNSLASISRWQLPAGLVEDIRTLMNRYGSLRLIGSWEQPVLNLVCEDEVMMRQLETLADWTTLGLGRWKEGSVDIPSHFRGRVKQELTRLGYPVVDLVGYHSGSRLKLSLTNSEGTECRLRSYQQEAVEAFRDSGGRGGSGVLVLPCGAGKTVIGIGVINQLQCETLILTSNTTSIRQWIAELTGKTSLAAAEIGEYSGERKQIRPITVATYQMLSRRNAKDHQFPHMKLLSERSWGLIIYDEVHLLPAPVFRATAEIQATRRLGLTATLIREDGREQDVFSLIGPKRYDMPWKMLEQQGWLAGVECREVHVPLPLELKEAYQQSAERQRFRLASENPDKLPVIRQLLSAHQGHQTLVIGHYLDQLRRIADELEVPLITGSMGQQERQNCYDAFRSGEIRVLVVSKVANFAIDLPDAAVAIEVSGTFGSRQEEAQRLGRVLRPKSGDNKAYFYTLVSADTKEQLFAARRQMFLVEQGYEYRISRVDGTSGAHPPWIVDGRSE
ncbi:helicase-associated domain-containing protein [Paenibacillus sp. JX-17]|uniref:DNA 3'-5' helicase n=1 Tax=Paenibacillus lacisoli TaxID=3064525 RepID=A0ABT9C7R1_9BACL|nr:DNA repair helicase XPB [Paenibacillus sp. JX-17]MDO7905266.1 helicase-associated domain-containing protein [Paenibacillus sp. JX-17]